MKYDSPGGGNMLHLQLNDTCKTVCCRASWTLVLPTIRLWLEEHFTLYKMEIHQDEDLAALGYPRPAFSFFRLLHFKNPIPKCKYLIETDQLLSLQYANTVLGLTPELFGRL